MPFDALQHDRASVPIGLSGCVRSSRHWVCDSLAAPKKKNNLAETEESAGCAIVISRDRWFLDRVATHILAFEGDSKVTFFDGTARAGVRRARRGGPGVPSDFVANDSRRRWQTSQRRCTRNFSEYEEWRKQQLGDAATKPHRITYRRLTK